MAKHLYMLDTNTCSFLIRNQPKGLIDKLQEVVSDGHQVTISAITYAELCFGSINKKASPKMPMIVAEFVERLDAVLAWDKTAVEHSTLVKKELERVGAPIGHNDTLLAGHAIAAKAILITDNVKEFSRDSGLQQENWVERINQ